MRKAQVEAPIELVVAVIILTMSIALAFYVMGRTDESKCISVLKTETENLQAAMNDVALGSPPTSRTVYFKMPRCGSIDVQVLQFVYFSDPAYCKLCASHYGGCWQIIPNSVKEENGESVLVPVTDAISCINMAGNIEITEQDCGTRAQLTENACPIGLEGCKAYVPDVGDWRSFLGGSSGFRNYEIKLTKKTIVRETEEVGAVNVCIKPVS